MTTPKIKCKHCNYEGGYNEEIYSGVCQDCGEGKKCPKCGNDKITNIPSSTLPIIGDEYIDGSKVDKRIWALHKSIHFICSRCTFEW